MVSVHDFADTEVGQCFEAAVTMYRAGKPIADTSLLVAGWRAMGIGNHIKTSELLELISSVPNGAHAVYYAERVASLASRRKLLRLADELGQAALDFSATPEETSGWVDGRLRLVSRPVGSSPRRIEEVWDEAIGDIQARVGNPEPAVLLSGLPAADARGFVFGAGEITILAARPGVGKTSLATQIAMHHAGKGRSVLFASLEMRDKELALRPLVASAGHNHQLIRTSRADQSVVDDLRAAKESLGSLPLHVWSPGRVSAAAIHAQTSIAKASCGVQLLIVDYLGLVRPEDKSRERYEQIGQVMKSLRDIGQHLQIPVLTLCQLNREADNQEPRLANLRESGDIEQDADVVAFLHPTDPKDESKVDLIVAKARNSGKGRASLLWRKEQTVFEDPTAPKRHSEFDEFNRGGSF